MEEELSNEDLTQEQDAILLLSKEIKQLRFELKSLKTEIRPLLKSYYGRRDCA